MLIFVSLDDTITIRSTRTSVDLSALGDRVYGINRIELTGDNEQELRFNSAAIKRLNSTGRLQILTADKDTVPVGRDWKYSQSSVQASLLSHVFATSDGATIELNHSRQWQNPINVHDASGNGTVEPRDALLVINQINVGSRLPLFNPNTPNDFFFADTSGDGVLSPIDALLIINQINLAVTGGEAEPISSPPLASTPNAHARSMAPEIVDISINELELWDTETGLRRRRR